MIDSVDPNPNSKLEQEKEKVFNNDKLLVNGCINPENQQQQRSSEQQSINNEVDDDSNSLKPGELKFTHLLNIFIIKSKFAFSFVLLN